MKTITITLPPATPHTYDVRIGAGFLATIGQSVKAVAPAPTAAIISDSTVAPLYLKPARESLAFAGYRVIEHIIPAGEQHKTIDTAVAALDVLLRAKVERNTPVIALGGGVLGDLTGFVSATLLRGTPFIQVPTTLLAAVDASVGGKVGVDHAVGKNLIGAFHQPRLVLTDIDTFATLPPRELRAGLAECIKHAIIRDHSLFVFISENVGKIMSADPETLTDLVARNVAIKAAIVQEDPYERGVRALLNLGHTFGHAIETVTGYSRFLHGECVALGTLAAARLAHRRGMMQLSDVKRIDTLLEFVKLPVFVLDLDVEDVFDAMFADKKIADGKLRFILPTKIGAAEIVRDVSDEDVRWAIRSLKQPILAEHSQS